MSRDLERGTPRTAGPGDLGGRDDDPVLPESTADDTDRGWGERPSSRDARDLDWYREQRPPHYE